MPAHFVATLFLRPLNELTHLHSITIENESDLFLSIIIPACNSEPLLGRCLDSIKSNVVGVKFEVIVIANGCLDLTVDVALQYQNLLPIIIRDFSTALGPAAARNIGLTISKGDWITFLDADDELTPDSLPGLRNATKVGDADIIVGSYLKCSPNGTLTTSSHQTTTYGLLDEDFLSNYIRHYCLEPYKFTLLVHCWGKFYRRQFLAEIDIKFNDALHQLEDVNFNLNLITYKPRIIFINFVIYKYYVSSNAANLSSISGDSPRAIDGIITAYTPILKVLELYQSVQASNGDRLHQHLVATTALLWLIRTGRKFSRLTWNDRVDITRRYLSSETVRNCMKHYQIMSGTSKLLPFLYKINSPLLVVLFFSFRQHLTRGKI